MVNKTLRPGLAPVRTWRTVGVCLALVVAISVLMMLPAYLDGISVFWLSGILISMLFATSYHLLLGTTGLLSFGHAAHFGIGAYVAGIAYREGQGFLAMLLICIVISLAASAVLGFLTLRATGVQFAILTLALSMVLHQTTFIFREFTGGDDGIPALSPPPLEFFGAEINLMIPDEFFRVLVVVVLLGLAFLYVIDKSSLGHTLRAIRDDPIRSQYLGFRPLRYRMIAFILSGTVAGIAGAMFVTLNGIVTPISFYWTTSSLPLIMVLLGGMRSFWGAIIGAVVYEGLMYLTADVIHGVNIYLGLLILTVVLFMPKGIVGIRDPLHKLAQKLRDRYGQDSSHRAKQPPSRAVEDAASDLKGATHVH